MNTRSVVWETVIQFDIQETHLWYAINYYYFGLLFLTGLRNADALDGINLYV